MPKTYTDPALRFSDVWSYWLAVESEGDSITIPCEDERRAIQIMHRLHIARKAARGPAQAHEWDSFIVRRVTKTITISRRASADLTTVLDSQGNPMDFSRIYGGNVPESWLAKPPPGFVLPTPEELERAINPARPLVDDIVGNGDT